jgi:hypothetical protein
MGLRGELFSTRVLLPNRTYFFNVKENRMGDLYLNIVESKNRDEGGFDRQSVILFADDLQEFLKGFDESLRVLEKEVRERKKQGRTAAHENVRHDNVRHDNARHDKHDDKTEHPHKPRKRPSRQDGSRQDGGREGGGREGKRVIVKKV